MLRFMALYVPFNPICAMSTTINPHHHQSTINPPSPPSPPAPAPERVVGSGPLLCPVAYNHQLLSRYPVS